MFGNGYFGNGYYGDGWYGPIVDTGIFLLVQDTGSGQDQLLVNLGQTADYFGNSYFSHGYLAGGYFGPPSGDKTIAVLDSGGVVSEDFAAVVTLSVSDQSDPGSDSVSAISISIPISDFGQSDDTISDQAIVVTIPVSETGSGFDSVPVSQEDFKQIAEVVFSTEPDPTISVSLEVSDSALAFEPTGPLSGVLVPIVDSASGADSMSRDGHRPTIKFTLFQKKKIIFELN